MNTIKFLGITDGGFASDAVGFLVLADGKKIQCAITDEALKRYIGEPEEPTDPMEQGTRQPWKDLVNLNCSRVVKIVAKKIDAGEFEGDGTILIKDASLSRIC